MDRPYLPEPLPPPSLDHKRLLPLVGRANAALARYAGLLEGMVAADVLLSPLTNEEAVLSSRIEGTQATQYELFQFEAGIDQPGEKAKDIQEIVNYRKALRAGEDALSGRPFSLHLVRALHAILLDSVRGKDRHPGQFRRDQNWIGRPGCPIEEASFVPPPPTAVTDAMEQWIDYLAGEDVDPIVQTAIAHAQFEMIHPFEDGNGRIGRVVVTLSLYMKRLLARPAFYLSRYLERARDEYYQRLLLVSERSDWTAWIEFFLKAVEIQSEENTGKVRRIMELYDRTKKRIIEVTRSQYAGSLVDGIFTRPVFPASMFVSKKGIERTTANALVRKLKGCGILTEIREAQGRRPAVLCFPELLAITEE